MEVIMPSPVQECSMMENGEGNDAAELTKSKKRRQKKKLKLNAENPDSKLILPHFYIISQSSLQDNPNSSLGTTATASVDQQHAVLIPAAGDANTGSKREDQTETSSNKMISCNIATPDAKTVSKGEEDTKVANGETGSGTTATDNTVSIKTKRKNKKKKRKMKNQASNDMVTVENDSSKSGTDDAKVSKGEEDSSKTATDDVKMVIKGEEDSSKTGTDDVKMVSKGEEDASKRGTDDAKVSKGEEDSSKTATDDVKMVSRGEEDTKVANGETGSGTTATDNTVSKKRKNKKKKNQASNDMVNVENDSSKSGTDDAKVSKGEEDSSKTATDDVRMVSKGEEDSSKTATDDVKMVSKREENTKVANGEMGSCTTATDNTVSKKRKKMKNQASNDMVTVENSSSKPETDDAKVSKGEENTKVANGDANTGSKREDHMEASSNKMISGNIAIPDANTMSKEEDTKLANGEMASCTTATDNTVSKKRKRKKKEKNEGSNDMVNVEKDSIKTGNDDVKMVSKGEEDTKLANDVMALGATATDNTVSKKRKRKKKEKNEDSNDMVNVEKDSIKTGNDDVKMVSKGEEDTKLANDVMALGATATDNTVSKKKKRKKQKENHASDDIVNVEKDSSKTATDDVKMISKGEEETKVVNGEMDSGITSTDNTVSKKKKKKKKNEASDDMVNVEKDSSKTGNDDVKMVSKGEEDSTLDEILNPQYLELIDSRSQNKKIQEKKKQEVSNATMDAQSRSKPKLGDILNPRHIEEVETAEGNRELSKKRKKIQPSDLNTRDVITQGKKLLIFDVNGLLADIVSPCPKDIKADKYIPRRAIFKRPFLDGFLRFCFERFNVAIWSSRTNRVLDPVVDFLLGGLKKNLVFIWDNSFCTHTWMNTVEDKHKPMVFKDLRKIWLKNDYGNSWVKGTFHESNTLLLDDSPYKALLNPKNTAIFPESYSYKNRNDDFLAPNGDLRRYLEGLAESDDVKTYVEQHPFGQSAIDQTHPHWATYSKALKGQNYSTR